MQASEEKIRITVGKISQFLVFIPIGPKYSPQDPVFKYLYLCSSFNVRDRVSKAQFGFENVMAVVSG